MIKEPREGQKVIFVLRKVDDTPTRYGVVLMINGQNNLLMGRATTPSSPMWILNRKLPVAAVLGFQTENHSLEPFRILSARESLARLIDYGPDVGTINLVVYREMAAGDERKALDKQKLGRGSIPAVGPGPGCGRRGRHEFRGVPPGLCTTRDPGGGEIPASFSRESECFPRGNSGRSEDT